MQDLVGVYMLKRKADLSEPVDNLLLWDGLGACLEVGAKCAI